MCFGEHKARHSLKNSDSTGGGLIFKIIKPFGHTTGGSRKPQHCIVFYFHTINLSYPNNHWTKHQRHGDRWHSFAPYRISTLISRRPQIITKTRSLAYRLHRMELPLLFLPPVQESRSIWQSGISLRSCSCCSSGVQQLPHRFLPSHELEAQTYTLVRKHMKALCNIFHYCIAKIVRAL